MVKGERIMGGREGREGDEMQNKGNERGKDRNSGKMKRGKKW